MDNRIAGSLLAIAGGYCLQATIRTSIALLVGLCRFRSLDAQQRQGVLKFRAVHTLCPSQCSKRRKALVIVGLRHGTEPAAELAYEHCDTYYAYAKNETEAARAVEQAGMKLKGERFSLIILEAHGNVDGLAFGDLKPTNERGVLIKYIKDFLAEDGQLLLLGCDSSKRRLGISNQRITPMRSFTENVAVLLPGRRVTGFDEPVSGRLISASYSKNRFWYHAYEHFYKRRNIAKNYMARSSA